MKVSIIIPVIREDKVKECISAIERHADVPLKDYEICIKQDMFGLGCPTMVRELVHLAKYDVIMFLGDDTIPQKGFLKEAIKIMKSFPDRWGIVGLNTNDPRGTNPLAHWMAHRKILDYMPEGDFFSLEYNHCYCDNELKDIAEEMGRWKFAEDSIIEHDHPVNNRAEWDTGYERAYGNDKDRQDRKTYIKRKIARNKKNHGIKLGIGWPLTDNMVYANFVYSFLKMKKMDHDLFIPHYPGKIDAVRNDIVKQALEAGCTHLWMTDTDQFYYDSETLNKMLSHKADIVSAPVMRRYPPFDPMLWRMDKDKKKYELKHSEIKKAFDNEKTLETNVTGAGSILFNTEVFLNIEEPWFRLPEYGESGPGEDIYFWNKVYDAGYKIITDCSIEVEHLAVMGIGFKTHQLFRKIKHMED